MKHLFDDNKKLLGLAFDMKCGCTIAVDDILPAIDLINKDQSDIYVKVRIVYCCEKVHRKDILGEYYFEVFEIFMDKIIPAYGDNPPLNTIHTMKGLKKNNDNEETEE